MEIIDQLPEIGQDIWEMLATDTRPILIYGMGNGAEKLIEHLALIGRTPAGVFASDGFVRGQSFCGYRVERFATLCERYPDPVILLAFGTRLFSVIEDVEALAREHTLLVPDLPVAGEMYFTSSLLREHRTEFEEALSLFREDASRRLFCEMVRAKLTGELSCLLATTHTEAACYACLAGHPISLAVDGGAYNGDTVSALLSYRPEIARVIAVEADRRNYNKLLRYAETDPARITPYYGALWNKNGVGVFSGSGNRNATLVGSASHKFQAVETPLITVDSLPTDRPIDYIKYDVEGAELEALEGSRQTILRDRPALAVSLYHRAEDMFRLPLYIHKLNPSYRFYLRRTRCLPAWELMLYAV